MPKILIIGATGFIGSHLSLEAKKRNYQVFAAVRKESNHDFLQKNDIYSYELNLNNKALLENQIANIKHEIDSFDYIIYNVGCTQSLNKQDYYTINFEYLKNFISALQTNTFYPKKLLFTSSLAVHQPGDSNSMKPITEKDALLPVSHYGKSKLQAELFLKTIKDFPIVIARPTAVYGPKDLNFLSLIKSINNHIELYPINRKQRLSMLHIDDLVDAFFSLLENDNCSGAYLISDGNHYSLQEINNSIKAHLNRKTIKLSLPLFLLIIAAFFAELRDKIKSKAGIFNLEKVKEIKARNWQCDISKLKNDVGFHAKYNFNEGIKTSINWIKDNGYI